MRVGRPMIDVAGLAKRHGEVRALRGLDLCVEEGSVLALIGATGAGKTTLVRIIATLARTCLYRIRLRSTLWSGGGRDERT